MNPSIAAKLAQLSERLLEVNQLLSTEEATKNMDTFRKWNRERAELEPVVELYSAYQACQADISAAEEMLDDSSLDAEMREFADTEIRQGQAQLTQLDTELQKQLLPKDPNDERSVFLEVRAGTGGDEAAIFSGDLFRMYTRFAERQRWQVEIISESGGEMGGYKEVIARIVGQGAYSVLKFESGAHRVQRVPATETQGRVHTSACTVAVLPEVDEVNDVVLNPADLRIDTFRASGAGGQHINKTDSAVRVTHLPTGLVAQSQASRSQISNRETAMNLLKARLIQLMEQQRKQHLEDLRGVEKDIAWGNQIRNYVFHPYKLVKDTRTAVETTDLQSVMDGDLDRFIHAQLKNQKSND